jgi:hypothetical protein
VLSSNCPQSSNDGFDGRLFPLKTSKRQILCGFSKKDFAFLRFETTKIDLPKIRLYILDIVRLARLSRGWLSRFRNLS